VDANNMLIEHLQKLPWFREPSSSEIDGACLYANSHFNLLDSNAQRQMREDARQWLRAWKAQANVKWLEAEPAPQYRRRDKR
jgi:hypothetical protein